MDDHLYVNSHKIGKTNKQTDIIKLLIFHFLQSTNTSVGAHNNYSYGTKTAIT